IVVARVELPGEPRPWRGVVEALLAAVAWGVSVVALRVPLDEVDPVGAQAVRLPGGALLLWAPAWAAGGRARMRRGGVRRAVRRASRPSGQPAAPLHLRVCLVRRDTGAASLRGVHVLLVCDDVHRSRRIAEDFARLATIVRASAAVIPSALPKQSSQKSALSW